MISAGTVCPIDGKIGAEAMALWAKYGHERPDYKTYVKRMDDRKKADKKAEKEMTQELEKMDKLKAKEEARKIEWKEPK
jgi:hypothetical protein